MISSVALYVQSTVGDGEGEFRAWAYVTERCGYSEVLWAARVSVQVCVLWDMPEVEVPVAQDQREWAYIVSWLAVFMSR